MFYVTYLERGVQYVSSTDDKNKFLMWFKIWAWYGNTKVLWVRYESI